MPNILITNDDGIHAPGLRALVDGLKGFAEITVVAPSRERSAAAQSLTLRQPIYCDQIAEREYSIDGTPADAMILAFHTLLKEKPDLVISGINRGGNLGENIYYSGTVGAAMEAAINRVPAVAVSVAYRGREFDFAPAAHFARSLAPLVLSVTTLGSQMNLAMTYRPALLNEREAEEMAQTVIDQLAAVAAMERKQI